MLRGLHERYGDGSDLCLLRSECDSGRAYGNRCDHIHSPYELMALLDDLNTIAIASRRAVTIVQAAQLTTTILNLAEDADTTITLTPAQKQAVRDRVDPLIVVIKTRAALLP